MKDKGRKAVVPSTLLLGNHKKALTHIRSGGGTGGLQERKSGSFGETLIVGGAFVKELVGDRIGGKGRKTRAIGGRTGNKGMKANSKLTC